MDVLKQQRNPSRSETRANPKQRSRPRLLYVLGLAPRKIGGIEKFLRYFVIALDAAGWDAVLCFDGQIADEFREYIAVPSVTIESLPNQGNLGLACAGELWKLLRKYKPQVFVYAFHSVLRCFPWLARLAGCKRVFYNNHSSRPPDQQIIRRSIFKTTAGRFLTMPLTAIVSVSEYTRRTGDPLGVTSAPNIVVPNGVEVQETDPRRRAEFRRRYGISNEDIVITQVGWMVEAKGVSALLRAGAALLREHTGIHFLFVGDGPDLPSFQKLANELGIEGAATFTGLISNPTATGVYDASDIYCQPSVHEASPLAVMEAMSVKLPVIASDAGGLPELVEHGRSGFLVPIGGSQEICTALEQLVCDSDMRRSMGEAGYELILKEHKIGDVARKYVEVFSSGYR